MIPVIALENVEGRFGVGARARVILTAITMLGNPAAFVLGKK
jgi:hypothetical protein